MLYITIIVYSLNQGNWICNGYAAIDMVSLPHGLYVVTLQANGVQEPKS